MDFPPYRYYSDYSRYSVYWSWYDHNYLNPHYLKSVYGRRNIDRYYPGHRGPYEPPRYTIDPRKPNWMYARPSETIWFPTYWRSL
uniref:Uncharacterized protein n=1 Tax=Acrobeloides nanus TaxID=290746 RepID=A0A914CIG9_9BILA